MLSPNDKKRVVVVALGFFFIFSLLIIQYYKVQILEGDKWARVATRQHYFVVKEPFIRGTFYSNTSIKRGHPEEPQKLVTDIQKFHLHVDPSSIPEELREEIATNLGHLLDTGKPALIAELEKKSRHRTLSTWLSSETKDAVFQWWYPFAKQHHIPRNSLFCEADYQRSYPFGKLLGAVLQTVQNRRDEHTGQAIPTGGLELTLNKYLQVIRVHDA